MIFNDATDNTGLVQDADFLLGTDSTRYPLKDKARIANGYMDKAVSIILKTSGTWQWDDTNNTDLPIGTTNIVSGQRDYTLDTDYLTIDKVLIDDGTGNFTTIPQTDEQDPWAGSYLANNTGNDGIPFRYDLLGMSLFLDAVPNYNATGGLKVYFKRGANYFVSTDTTKEPGIPTHLHKYISLGMAYEYAMKKGMNIAQSLAVELQRYEKMIAEHFNTRNVARQNKVISRYRNPA